MSTELSNLLPPERRASLARAYALRVASVALIGLGMLVLVHGTLLAPSFSYMRDQKAVQEQRLAELSEKRAVSGFTDLSARVAAFSARAASLEELRARPTASESVRAILALPRSGVTLNAFTFTAPQGSDAGRMSVAGIAATRESLRAFDASLNGLSFVAATDLPLSAYAKERDIPFSIALTLDFASTP